MKSRSTRLIDIAHRANVSYTAVAQVLRGSAGPNVKVGNAKANHIRRIATEMGYVPNHTAQQLAGKRSGVIGVIGSHWFDPIRSSLLVWLEHCADEQGYVLIASHTGADTHNIDDRTRDFKSRGVDGIIYVAHGSDAHWLDAARCLKQLPVVVTVLGDPEVNAGHCVLTDYAFGSRLCVEHLHQRGRRRIVQLLEDLVAEANCKRWIGFVQAHRDLGRPVDDEDLCLARAGWSKTDPDRYNELCEELIVRRNADAIVAYDDVCAMHLLRAMRRRGIRTPEDVAVISWGNGPGEHFDPPITTVDIQVPIIARRAVGILTDAVARSGEIEASRVNIQPELIVRESS